MGKAAPDAVLDKILDEVATGTAMKVCSSEPTTYTEANATFMLATVVMAGGDFAKANDTSGRKLTMTAKSGISITNSGNAQHVAIVRTADTTLLYVTTCTLQALTAGGTVDVPTWKINIQDPT